MTNDPPDFATLTRLGEAALSARLEAVRATLKHAGEKGRVLEQAVASLLREFLPTEYGLSSGFVAYHCDGIIRLSPQLDIIIYDAVRTGPLPRLGACDVFPLEAVHGYVEVKATICSSSDDAQSPADNSVERCLAQNRELRHGRPSVPRSSCRVNRRFDSTKFGNGPQFVDLSWHFRRKGRLPLMPTRLHSEWQMCLAVWAIQPTWHGVFVAGLGYFRTRPVDSTKAKEEDCWHVDFVRRDHGLSVFRGDLLHGLARFPRYPSDWAPALEEYFPSPTWESRRPS